MTKEEIISIAKQAENQFGCYYIVEKLNKFFNSNVCIPKGNNRHPDADALHSYAEGEKMQFMIPAQTGWIDDECRARYRIKPSEPVYEWQWYYVYKGHAIILGNTLDNVGFYTDDEVVKNGSDKYIKIEETKRERKV